MPLKVFVGHDLDIFSSVVRLFTLLFMDLILRWDGMKNFSRGFS